MTEKIIYGSRKLNPLKILTTTQQGNKKLKTVLFIFLSLFILLLILVLFVLSSPPQLDNENEIANLFRFSHNYMSFSDPQIALFDNNIYFVWTNVSSGNSSDVYFKLGNPENLSKNPGNSTDPQIAVYGNSTYVVWKDNTDGNDEIYLKISEAGKTNFGKLINLSKNPGNSTDPQIAVYGNSTYVVWKDNSSGYADMLTAAIER